MVEVIRADTGVSPTAGEQRALQCLTALPDDWLVLSNIILPVRYDESREIDLIVVSPHRVFALDEKSWRGTITGTAQVWTSRNGNVPSPLNKIDMVAKPLAGRLRQSVQGFPGPTSTVPVIGGIFLSDPNVQARINDPRAERCLLNLDNAIERLRWLDDAGKKAGFDLRPLRGQIKKALYDENSHRTPKHPKEIGFFQVNKFVAQRTGVRIYVGTHEDGFQRTLYRYDRTIQSGTELDHELSALRTLQQRNVVPRMGEAFPDAEGRFRVVPVEPPVGTSVDALPRPGSSSAALRWIDVAAAAFSTLAEVHEQKIIHRSIRPETVFIYDPVLAGSDPAGAAPPTVMLTNFVSARIDQMQTIVDQLDAAGFDDPYAAPEIRKMKSYGFANPTSDVFSLALVFLERLTTLNASAIVAQLENQDTLPDDAAAWPYLAESAAARLREAFERALTFGAYDGSPRPTAREFADTLRTVAIAIKQEAVHAKGDLFPPYRVIKFLGEGTSARTYLVEDTGNGNIIAAKQYLRPSLLGPDSQPMREFNLLYAHPHPNLPRHYSRPDEKASVFQSTQEWIDGETLTSKLSEITHDRVAWATLMQHVLDAVGFLEEHELRHRDIKPDNIIIRSADGRVFLIDYGASSNVAQLGGLVGTPRYWPPEWRTEDQYPDSGDRYAVAVTLFEALTGVLPFKTEGTGDGADPLDAPPPDLPAEFEPVARALLRAVAIDPGERYASIAELRTALDHALTQNVVGVDGPALSDDEIAAYRGWIDDLRGLFRNSRRGNADNRGLDTDFARQTYVPTALDTKLWPAVLEYRPAAVFLSGNPGDGKTAFLAQVRTYLRSSGATVSDENDPSGWDAMFDGHTFRAVFDASESASGRSADEQVAFRLRGLEGQRPNADTTVLIAINDGRLAEMRERFENDFPWLTEQIAVASAQRSDGSVTTEPVWLVDLKQRSYVALQPDDAHPSVMREMLRQMVYARRWPDAGSNLVNLPMVANAAALRQTGPHSPAQRLEFLLTLAHLRGERHTTVRDLRSALALLITGDLSFDEVLERDGTEPREPWSGRYWSTAFTTDSTRDLVLGELRWLDPARFAHPELERFLYFHRRPEDAPARTALFADGQDLPPPPGDDVSSVMAWMKAAKRRFVLEGAPRNALDLDPLNLLPYRSARQVIAVLAGVEEPSGLRAAVLRGIGRSDGIEEARHTEDFVLSVKKSGEFDIEMVKAFPAERFTLSVDVPGGGALIETTPRTLQLHHDESQARVRLNLDLIETLTRLAEGLDPASQELQPLLEELAPFKSRIQRSTTDRLLVIEGTRRHWIEKRGDSIVRQNA